MTKNNFNKDLIAFIYMSILAVIAVVYAFSILPNPKLQRDINFDQQRITNITDLQSQIGSFYTNEGNLPQTIDVLVNNSSYYGNHQTTDPLTKAAYEYTVLTPTTYQLCAVFAIDSDTINKYATNDTTYTYSYSTPLQVKTKHPAGHFCFESTVTPQNNYYNENPTIMPICLGKACPINEPATPPTGSMSAYPTVEFKPTWGNQP